MGNYQCSTKAEFSLNQWSIPDFPGTNRIKAFGSASANLENCLSALLVISRDFIMNPPQLAANFSEVKEKRFFTVLFFE